MKNILMVLLTVVAFGIIFLNNYFQHMSPLYKEKVAMMNSDINSTSDIVSFNKWLKIKVIPMFEKLETQEEAERSLVNIQNKLTESIRVSLLDLNKDKDGKIVMLLSSVIYKNEINKLINLYKLNIKNGVINFKNIKVDDNNIITEFELIKFYRDEK